METCIKYLEQKIEQCNDAILRELSEIEKAKEAIAETKERLSGLEKELKTIKAIKP